MAPKKIRSYCAKEKLAIIKRAKEIGNSAAGKEFGVSEANIRRWRLEESVIEKMPKHKRALGTRTAKWPELEKSLLNWIRSRRVDGLPVSRMQIKLRANEIAREENLEDFTGASSWCTRFMKRNGLSLRVKTSVGQNLPKDWEERAKTFHTYVDKCIKSKNVVPDAIINMDEVPLSFDSPPNRTVDEKGTKSIFLKTSGNEKNNFTVVLAVCASGQKLTPMLIFKRKTIPKDPFPQGVSIEVNPKGWMTEEVMLAWLEKIYQTENQVEMQPAMLVLDSMRAHITENVKQAVGNLNTTLAVIPGGLTKKLQPLDLTINHVFKMEVRRQWEAWMANGVHTYTKSGKLKKASFAEVSQWVKSAWDCVQPSTVVKAFPSSGIIPRTGSEPDTEAGTSSASLDCIFSSDTDLTSDFETDNTASEVEIACLFNSDNDDSEFLGFE